MKIGYLGMSHLGLNYLAATATKKYNVYGFDLNNKKINRLQKCKIDLTEPNLKEAIFKNRNRILFSNNLKKIKDLDLLFVSIDLKTNKNGKAELAELNNLIKIAIKHINKRASLIILSQVKPGYTRRIKFDNNRLFYQVETLVFGNSFKRALKPERIIVGSKNKKISNNYQKYLSSFDCPIINMSYENAELTKISINLFLASSVTVTNLLARTCKKINANWSDIVPALKLDKRIGKYAYLSQGLGISGGNLERDLFTIKNIIKKKDPQGLNLINAFIKNSIFMKNWIKETVKKKIKKKTKLGIIGLSYKEGTDSLKNAPSLDLINFYKPNEIFVYDPVVQLKKKKTNLIQLKKPEEIFKK